MLFGVVSGVGLGMGVLDVGGLSKGMGQFWGEFGASRCNQWDFCNALFLNYFEDLLYTGCWNSMTALKIHILHNTSQHQRDEDTCTELALYVSTAVLHCNIQLMKRRCVVARDRKIRHSYSMSYLPS